MPQFAGRPQILEEKDRVKTAPAAQFGKLLTLLRPLLCQGGKMFIALRVRRQQALVVGVPVEIAIRTPVGVTRAVSVTCSPNFELDGVTVMAADALFLATVNVCAVEALAW